MFKNVVLVVCLVGFAQSAFVPREIVEDGVFKTTDLELLKQEKADASNYLDQILANLREQLALNGMNVIPLGDQEFGFEREIGGVVWHGEATLYNGSLKNMDTIHRTGAAEIITESNGDILVSAEVGVNRGQLNYDMTVKFMDLGPHAVIHGTLSRVRVLLQIRVTSKLNVTLEKFDIKDTGLLTVDIKGLGVVLNFLVEIVTVFLGNLIKGFVALLLEGVIKDTINDIISKILFPPTAFAAVSAVKAAASFIV